MWTFKPVTRDGSGHASTLLDALVTPRHWETYFLPLRRAAPQCQWTYFPHLKLQPSWKWTT